MHLIQLFLPLADNDGQPLPRALFDEVRAELVERFGGLTAYSRAPVVGLWKEEPAAPAVRDDLVIYELMAESLDEAWWKAYRERLESRFRQEKILLRAQAVRLL